METKTVLRAVLALAATVSFGLTGCQTSSWNIRNPFERKPKPEIKSPAEMDDIQLKAPPERYTKDDYLRNAEKSEKSLAQAGEYGEKAGSAEYDHRDSEKVATRDSSESSSSSTTSSSSEAAPGFDDYPGSVPFAPGSIGEAELR